MHVKHNCGMFYVLLCIVLFTSHLAFVCVKTEKLQYFSFACWTQILTTGLLKIIMPNIRVISMKIFVTIINHSVDFSLI